MTRAQTIDIITAKLEAFTTEQLVAFADIVDALRRDVPDEDDETGTAITEGISRRARDRQTSQGCVRSLHTLRCIPWLRDLATAIRRRANCRDL